LGTLASLVFVTGWWLPFLLKRHFEVPFFELGKAVMAPVAIGLPYWVLNWWFAHALPPQGWVDLAVKMTGSALLYLTVAWAGIFTADERAVWRLRLRLLVRPGPAL
jgi:hypothetical protein